MWTVPQLMLPKKYEIPQPPVKLWACQENEISNHENAFTNHLFVPPQEHCRAFPLLWKYSNNLQGADKGKWKTALNIHEKCPRMCVNGSWKGCWRLCKQILWIWFQFAQVTLPPFSDPQISSYKKRMQENCQLFHLEFPRFSHLGFVWHFWGSWCHVKPFPPQATRMRWITWMEAQPNFPI